MIWNRLVEIQNSLENKFNLTGDEIQEEGMERFNQPGWVNRVWTSDHYRRAHVDVVDARESKKLWMMHVCVFPHLNNRGPIFGFDVIAGQNKMTGCFFDFSKGVESDHPMQLVFQNVTAALDWKKERKLPDWAQQIFSPGLIAAGNVSSDEEVDQIFEVVENMSNFYLDRIGRYNGGCDPDMGRKAHNRYAHYQKQNPHTPRVMASLGLDKDDVEVFIEKCLFPEV